MHDLKILQYGILGDSTRWRNIIQITRRWGWPPMAKLMGKSEKHCLSANKQCFSADKQCLSRDKQCFSSKTLFIAWYQGLGRETVFVTDKLPPRSPVFSHQSKTRTRQWQDKCWIVHFYMMPFTPGLSDLVWKASYRNAQVQHLSCRCLALGWKHHKSEYSLIIMWSGIDKVTISQYIL